MGRIKDLKGKRFGRLIAIGYDKCNMSKTHHIRWNCICDCGKKTITASKLLISGKTQSCGCLHRERILEATRKRPFENLYNRFVKASEKRMIGDILSYDDFVVLTQTIECHYCGSPIIWVKYNTGKNGSAYNLDRKNSNMGYTLENVVVCCKKCNRAKSNQYTHDEWICMATALKGYYKNLISDDVAPYRV
ncbi:MAG: hypothetical protein WA066_03025 [Candidatus Omnitrophota bacterium]